jgi:hypothetical protein
MILRLSIGYWITCARKNGKHRLGHCWCHRPERHLERCHFSLGRIPDEQQPTSKEARETAWHERLRALVQD